VGCRPFGWTRVPDGVSWPLLAGPGALARIRFTMPVFIASLAFDGDVLESAEVDVLARSVASGFAGYALLHWSLPRRRDDATGL